MKTLLIALVTLSLAGKSQEENIPLTISVSPTLICRGEMVKLKVYNPTHKPFFFMGQSTGEAPCVNWGDMYPTGWESDTAIYNLAIPDILGCGNASIGTDLYNLVPIFIKCDCIKVGIGEYSSGVNGTPEYYDLMGNKVEFRPNEMLIERYLNKTAKIIIKNTR